MLGILSPKWLLCTRLPVSLGQPPLTPLDPSPTGWARGWPESVSGEWGERGRAQGPGEGDGVPAWGRRPRQAPPRPRAQAVQGPRQCKGVATSTAGAAGSEEGGWVWSEGPRTCPGAGHGEQGWAGPRGQGESWSRPSQRGPGQGRTPARALGGHSGLWSRKGLPRAEQRPGLCSWPPPPGFTQDHTYQVTAASVPTPRCLCCETGTERGGQRLHPSCLGPPTPPCPAAGSTQRETCLSDSLASPSHTSLPARGLFWKPSQRGN